ncbi:hypothetical protein AB8L61_17080 [Clostridioides difficile]|nr:hypothetical protein [Clostridioides difficile]
MKKLLSFYGLLTKKLIYFPKFIYKKLICLFIEVNKKYHLFNETKPLVRMITIIIGSIMVVASFIGFDKEILEIEEKYKLLFLSEIFFLGFFLIILNLNLKKKTNIILIILALLVSILWNERIRTYFILFLIILFVCLIIFQIKAVFAVFVTLLFHLLFVCLIDTLIIYFNNDYFNKNLPNEHVYAMIYTFVTISLLLYLLVGYFSSKVFIKVMFNKDSAEKFSYKMFADILTSMYIISFFILNAGGYLYLGGEKVNYYNAINNSFLTLLTTSQLSKMDIFLYNIGRGFENIKNLVKKIVIKISKKELNK